MSLPPPAQDGCDDLAHRGRRHHGRPAFGTYRRAAASQHRGAGRGRMAPARLRAITVAATAAVSGLVLIAGTALANVRAGTLAAVAAALWAPVTAAPLLRGLVLAGYRSQRDAALLEWLRRTACTARRVGPSTTPPWPRPNGWRHPPSPPRPPRSIWPSQPGATPSPPRPRTSPVRRPRRWWPPSPRPTGAARRRPTSSTGSSPRRQGPRG